ncbi:22904_t:CDS:2, partial [Cetraspora pellucida]
EESQVSIQRFMDLHKVTIKESGHVTSFRPISNETKNKIFKLFETGHNSSSTYHTYWEQLQLNYENNKEILADRAIASHKNDVFYLYKKYHDQHLGAKNSDEMFNQLAKEIAEFNNNDKKKAWMQTYIAPEKDNPRQPFILVILTNLMIHCYALQKVGELVYMDMTTRLDILNTPLTILSISTPASGLFLGVIFTSDESANTFTKALDVLRHLILSTVFGKCRGTIGPQVIITDDYKAKGQHCIIPGKMQLCFCVFFISCK